MTETITPTWLSWAREIQALAQTGLHYSENEFDRERYERLLEISAEMIGNNSQLDRKELANVYARTPFLCEYEIKRFFWRESPGCWRI